MGGLSRTGRICWRAQSFRCVDEDSCSSGTGHGFGESAPESSSVERLSGKGHEVRVIDYE